jgi:hypothetical protein
VGPAVERHARLVARHSRCPPLTIALTIVASIRDEQEPPAAATDGECGHGRTPGHHDSAQPSAISFPYSRSGLFTFRSRLARAPRLVRFARVGGIPSPLPGGIGVLGATQTAARPRGQARRRREANLTSGLRTLRWVGAGRGSGAGSRGSGRALGVLVEAITRLTCIPPCGKVLASVRASA